VSAIPLAADAASDATVEIRTAGLSSPDPTVPVGTSVVWVNRGTAPHRVRSRNETLPFDSGKLETGERFSDLHHRRHLPVPRRS
jgi:plastocyanin